MKSKRSPRQPASHTGKPAVNSKIIANCRWDPHELQKSAAAIDRMPLNPAYDRYRRGKWGTVILANKSGDRNIGESVVIVVTCRAAHSPHRRIETGLFGHILKFSIPKIVIQRYATVCSVAR